MTTMRSDRTGLKELRLWNPLIRISRFNEHCKKYWKVGEVCAASLVGTFPSLTGYCKNGKNKRMDRLFAIDDGAARPNENEIPPVDGDVVAHGAFQVASIDGAQG